MRRLGLLLVGLSLCACSASDDTKSGGAGGAWDPNQGSGGAGGGGGGSSLPPGFEECANDTLSAGLARAANIVWVIDTSGSMDEEATLVQNNMNRFVESIVNTGLEDYRVVVVSQKKFVTVPDPLGSDSQHFLFVEEKVGSNEPLEALLSRFDDFSGFLLPGAITHYVVVTDDESDITATEFISDMGRELNGGSFRVHAIASPPGAPTESPSRGKGDKGCIGTYGDAAAPGVEHYKAADATGGLKFSICEADWSGLFSALATEVGQSASIPCELPIPEGDAGAVNPWILNLVMTRDNGQSELIPNVSRDQCGSGGFSYNDDQNPTRLVLCPSTCTAAAQATKLEIVVGCATEIM